MKQSQTYRIIAVLTKLLAVLHNNIQDILWKKSFGGKQSEYSLDSVPPFDCGFLLKSNSISRKFGNRDKGNEDINL